SGCLLETVRLGHPPDQLLDRKTESVLEWPSAGDGSDVVVRLESRPRHSLRTRLEINLNSCKGSDLDCAAAAQLSVTLNCVTVPQEHEGAVDVDRKVDSRTRAELRHVEVSAV